MLLTYHRKKWYIALTICRTYTAQEVLEGGSVTGSQGHCDIKVHKQ